MLHTLLHKTREVLAQQNEQEMRKVQAWISASSAEAEDGENVHKTRNLENNIPSKQTNILK